LLTSSSISAIASVLLCVGGIITIVAYEIFEYRSQCVLCYLKLANGL
jgi:hypothetical protein